MNSLKGVATFFNPRNSQVKSRDSLLPQLEAHSRVTPRSPDEEASLSSWRKMLDEHRVAKLKAEAQKSLNKEGLPFDEKTLKEIMWEIFTTNTQKVKRDATRPFSVISDKKGTPYAIFRGILGKGAFGKVKLVQNLQTKEFAVVKVCTQNCEKEGSFLKKRNLLRGKQERDNKKGGKKYYLFIDLLPGITVYDFYNLLSLSKEELTDKQQAQLLVALLKAAVKLMKADIRHTDLHAGNVLIDPLTWRANIVDFGLVQDLSGEQNKDVFYSGNLQSVLCFPILKNYITNPKLKALVESLKDANTHVIARTKETIKRIEKEFLDYEIDNGISSTLLMKYAIKGQRYDLLQFLLKDFVNPDCNINETIDFFSYLNKDKQVELKCNTNILPQYSFMEYLLKGNKKDYMPKEILDIADKNLFLANKKRKLFL